VDDGYGGVADGPVGTWEGVGALQKVGCISSAAVGKRAFRTEL
jgi:hypothetical protein